MGRTYSERVATVKGILNEGLARNLVGLWPERHVAVDVGDDVFPAGCKHHLGVSLLSRSMGGPALLESSRESWLI